MSKVTNLQNLRKPLPSTLPHYEMRARHLHGPDSEIELWQLPASATPHIKQPTYVAGLRGRNLSLIEHRLLRRLKACRIDIADLPAFDALRVAIDEEMAINLGLLFRALAPMRNREHMASVAAGIEEMSKEEAGYRSPIN